MSVLTIYNNGRHRNFGLLKQLFTGRVGEIDAGVFASDLDFQLRSGDDNRVVVGLYAPLHRLPSRLYNHEILSLRQCRPWRIEHSDNGFGAYLQFQDAALHCDLDTVGLPRKIGSRIQGVPLSTGASGKNNENYPDLACGLL